MLEMLEMLEMPEMLEMLESKICTLGKYTFSETKDLEFHSKQERNPFHDDRERCGYA